jgi:tellurite resistance protein
MIQLNAKALKRIRDHLLELGQPPSTHFLTAADEEDPFKGDEDSRRRFEALFEAMFLMVVADGKVLPPEQEALRGAVRTLTDNRIRTAQVNKLFDECKERSSEGLEKRLKAISSTLKEDPILSEAAFSLSAAIAFADNEIEDRENELINALIETLALDPARADELLNQLEGDAAEEEE